MHRIIKDTPVDSSFKTTILCGLAGTAFRCPSSCHFNSSLVVMLLTAPANVASIMKKSRHFSVPSPGMCVAPADLISLPSALSSIGATQRSNASGSCWKSPPISHGPLDTLASSSALDISSRFLSVAPSECHKYTEMMVTPQGTSSCTHNLVSLPAAHSGVDPTSPLPITPQATCLGVMMPTPADLSLRPLATACAPMHFSPSLPIIACKSGHSAGPQ